MLRKWALIIAESIRKMNKTRKIPLRKCVITQERYPKKALIRIVKNKEGEIFIDPSGKQNGRGAYLQKNVTVVKRAMQTKKLAKHLEVTIPDELYLELIRMIEDGEI